MLAHVCVCMHIHMSASTRVQTGTYSCTYSCDQIVADSGLDHMNKQVCSSSWASGCGGNGIGIVTTGFGQGTWQFDGGAVTAPSGFNGSSTLQEMCPDACVPKTTSMHACTRTHARMHTCTRAHVRARTHTNEHTHIKDATNENTAAHCTVPMFKRPSHEAASSH